MTKRFVLILLTLVSIAFAAQSFADEMEVLTTEEPPMNFMNKDKVSGFSTDIVKEIMRRTKTEGSIKLIPWARAYRIGLRKANVALFTMGRTAKRENLFHWVGPIVGKR